MPTNNEELLTKEQLYEEGKIGGRNKVHIQDGRLSEFIRITNEKLKRTIDITWNEARSDTTKKHIGAIWNWWATKPQKRKNDATTRIITRADIEELVRMMK